MMIICDFDYTLFNSYLLSERQKCIAADFGLSEIQWNEVREHFSHGTKKTGRLVSNEGYAKVAGDLYDICKSSFQSALEGLMYGECNMLFSDALDFLDSFSECDMILLTFGDPTYQCQKIAYAQIEGFFKEIKIVQGDKHQFLHGVIESGAYKEPYFFLDDKPENFIQVKSLGLPITTILLHHKESPRIIPATSNCDFTATSLHDAKDIIIKNI